MDDLGGDLDEQLRIDDVIANVRDDAAWAEKILPTLPEDLQEALTSDGFIDGAMDKFDSLDADGNEKLSPDELVPVIADLSQGQPWDVDGKHCAEFAEIFDADQNGFIDRREFVQFVQFLVVMSFMREDEPDGEEREQQEELTPVEEAEETVTGATGAT